MVLPRIDTPTYQTKLPSTGQEIQFRPFLVKEQKIIMIAQESNDIKQTTDALIRLVTSCTFNKIDIQNLPTFDVEYLFLKIRSKSAGESVSIQITCPDDEVTTVPVKLNLDDINLQVKDNHNNIIQINDKIKMILRYPTMSDVTRVGDVESSDGIFKLMYRCISEIHFGDDVFSRIDISDKEIEEFIDQLTTEQFESITQFFNTMPKLSHTVEVTNPKTKVKSEVVLEGLQSFLG